MSFLVSSSVRRPRIRSPESLRRWPGQGDGRCGRLPTSRAPVLLNDDESELPAAQRPHWPRKKVKYGSQDRMASAASRRRHDQPRLLSPNAYEQHKRRAFREPIDFIAVPT
jgi:hypothetical protein